MLRLAAACVSTCVGGVALMVFTTVVCVFAHTKTACSHVVVVIIIFVIISISMGVMLVRALVSGARQTDNRPQGRVEHI